MSSGKELKDNIMRALKIYCFLPVLALMAVACTQEQPTSEELCFSVRWGENPLTRTVLQEDGTSVWWCPDEYIKVFSNDMAGMFYSTNAENAETIEIRGGLVPNNGRDGNANGTYLALYPYDADAFIDPADETITLTVPCNQQGCSGTFADKTVPAVARSRTYSFSFYNVCGGARFSVTEPGIVKAVFSSVSGEPLAGKVCVGFDANGLPEIRNVIDGMPEITLQAPEGGFVPGEDYFVMLLPSILQNGLRITLFKSDIGRRPVVVDRPVTVHRAVFGTLDRMDAELWQSLESHPFTDLGLSVLWADMNLGAASPEEAGDYYAWGETAPKPFYTEENYVGTVDGDAAAAASNGRWMIPSAENWQELLDCCDWEWTDVSGVGGFRATSRVEGFAGASIFLPAAGYYGAGGFQEGGALYQSKTLSDDALYYKAFRFSGGQPDVLLYTPRYLGTTIRPVMPL